MTEQTPRERRAAQASATKKKVDLSGVRWGKMIGPLVVIALLALVMGMVFLRSPPEETCPGSHCHSTLHIWVEDDNKPEGWQRITWESNKYTYQGDGLGGIFPLRHHLHTGTSKEEVHWEPIAGNDVVYGDFLRTGDITLTSKEFRSEGGHESVGQGYGLLANETVDIRVYQAWGQKQNWQEISVGNFLDWEGADGYKHLVVVGQPTAEELTMLQEGVPDAPSRQLAEEP